MFPKRFSASTAPGSLGAHALLQTAAQREQAGIGAGCAVGWGSHSWYVQWLALVKVNVAEHLI